MIKRCECPRRYCWWWNSSNFNWDVDVKDGCEVTFESREMTGCSRADPTRNTDLYASHEPNLEEDGLPEDYFDSKESFFGETSNDDENTNNP